MSDKKKQIPLRISAELYGEIASWANDEFRSINGQIEYLLTECVKKRKGLNRKASLDSKEKG
ncbi:MAG TPA: Arc family DNA-binding protein [Bacillota bacterium]|nr:Arc family DNA-binding protein [Bacillota bacterium]